MVKNGDPIFHYSIFPTFQRCAKRTKSSISRKQPRAEDGVVVPYVGSVGVSGLGFLAAREGPFFFRCGRFLGADFSGFVTVLVLVELEDSGPKPKNAPGNERVLVFWGGGRVWLRCFSRCWLRFRPDLRRRDLCRAVMGFEVSATNQSFSGQTTGILYPSISSKGSRW